jgi:hypothetical protein
MKRLSILLLVLISSWFSVLGQPAAALQDYPDWQSTMPAARVTSDSVTAGDAAASMQHCTVQAVTIAQRQRTVVCIVEMKGWRYAYTGQGIIVGIGGDSQMYPVSGLPLSYMPLENPGSQTLVYHYCCQTIAGNELQVYGDFVHHLVRDDTGYHVDEAPVTLAYRDGSPVEALSTALGQGGDWLVAQTPNGIVRTNLATGETKYVSLVTEIFDMGQGGAMALAISDDGQTIGIGGELSAGRQFWIVSVSDSCGSHDRDWSTDTACKERDVTKLFDGGVLPDGWPEDFRLSPHGNRLDFYIQRFGGGMARASLDPSGSATAPLHYLALGDSFSSGEGDPGRDPATGLAYYQPLTNGRLSGGLVGDMCHISSRSYPFDLAGLLDFGSSNGIAVKSVACNNAHIDDVASDDPNGYQGQDGRLTGLSTAALGDARGAAIDSFLPGRLRQSVFVDRYQPAAITLGIGGNNVQFARVISACAESVLTCSYASDPTDRRNLGESIKALYPKLVALYGSLVHKDPGVRLHVVGYPRFVNEANVVCPGRPISMHRSANWSTKE